MKGDLLDYMRWTLLFGKYIGMMPIIGPSPGAIPRFTWKSVSIVMYISKLCIASFMFGAGIFNLIYSGLDFGEFNSNVFLAVFIILSLLLFRLCKRINYIIEKIQKLEKLLPPPWKPRSAVRFTNKLMVAVFLCAIGEHVIFVIYSIIIANTCPRMDDESEWFIKPYFMTRFSWYFKYFPFSYLPGIIFMIIEFQAELMWYYSDWLVMCVCIYLKNRFEDFNRLIIDEKFMFTKTFKPTWSVLQVHYNRLSKLVTIIDHHLNATVFVSYVSSLYYICLSLYIILNNLLEVDTDNVKDCRTQHSKDTLLLTLKFYDMLSITLKIALYSYLAAEVHVASRRSLMVLNSAPSAVYCNDMKRLMTQIYYSKTSISGLHFFNITRGMILAMVAQLFTYELVLVQI